MLRWGLIPYWAKEIKVGFANINAQAEGIESKPGVPRGLRTPALPCAGQQLFRMEEDANRQNSLLRSRSPIGAIMALAGLWENWHSPAGEWVRSFAIITTTPNQLCAELHNRMPVVLKPDVWPAWLGEQPAAVGDLTAVLAPYPSDEMICWPVSTRVGNVKNNDPSLIEPISLP